MLIGLLSLAFNMAILAQADPTPESIDLTAQVPVVRSLGSIGDWNRSPTGEVLSTDSASLMLNGRHVLWAMGEFHYSRYPADQWRTELLKMRAGGIDVVSTYVFWIHHEEVKGRWDWSGQRNLRRFLETAHEVGLKAFVRGGPWVHGECRNGGLPDWLVKECRTRTDDPSYLGHVSEFYDQIGTQLRGLLWKDGGPVIGFQLENEFGGPGEHLLNLKRLAIEAGIKVPIYSRTGWPSSATPPPPDEIVPMFGGYPVGFWDRGIEETARTYGSGYVMTLARHADEVYQGEHLHTDAARSHSASYPYLCCEIGGGMQTSYHRRIVIQPDEIGSLALVKLASGNNLQGYYMYHGGTNPDGKRSYLNETQATGYWNDVPVRGYDFQAPLGDAGQVREHYHVLRRMHLFMRDFGASLAEMPASLPSEGPDAKVRSTLRWSVRSDGRSGYLFVNNYERLRPMSAHPQTRFRLELVGHTLMLPSEPVTVPADSYFFWPFEFDLGGVVLRYATAQPICMLRNGNETAYFFAQTQGVEPELCFEGSPRLISANGTRAGVPGGVMVKDLTLGTSPAAILDLGNGSFAKIFVLSVEQSLGLWQGEFGGCEHVVLSQGDLWFDKDGLHVSASANGSGGISVYPPVSNIEAGGHDCAPVRDGEFSAFSWHAGHQQGPLRVGIVSMADAGPARLVPLGLEGVAEQPNDQDFEHAEVWRLSLPEAASRFDSPILRLNYVGDVARLYLDGRLVSDNFYNGLPYEIGLKALGNGAFRGRLELRILPLRKDAPVYFAPGMRPEFGVGDSVCSLLGADVSGAPHVVVRVPKSDA
jgi:hypothetical protein